MDNSSYLNPDTIVAQCVGAMSDINTDIESLKIARNAITLFMNEDELQGKAFTALKNSMQQYIDYIDTLISADQEDKKDFFTLEKSVGSEILDGSVILPAKTNAETDEKTHSQEASNNRTKAGSTSDPVKQAYYSLCAYYYDLLAYNDHLRYLYWKSKEDKYDAIDASTRTLFMRGNYYRMGCLADPNNPNSVGLSVTVPNSAINTSLQTLIRNRFKELEQKKATYEKVLNGQIDPVTLTKQEKQDIIDYYEALHAEDAKTMKKLLGQAEEEGYTDEVTDIKVILYTAQDPYRSALLNNIRTLGVGDIHYSDTACYKPDKKKIYFNIANFKNADEDSDGITNEANNYYVFFHELAHAADDYYCSTNVYFTTEYTNSNGQTVTDVLVAEVENKISDEIDAYNKNAKTPLTAAEKQEIIHTIMNTTMYDKNNPPTFSSTNCTNCYNRVVQNIQNDIATVQSNQASDIYGALTGNTFRVDRGHDVLRSNGDYYWIEAKKDANGNYQPVLDSNGNVTYTRSAAAEFFAENMSDHITRASGGVGMDSYNYYSSDTQQMFDDIANEMAK